MTDERASEAQRPIIRVEELSKVYPHPSAAGLLANFGRKLLSRPPSGTCALSGVSFLVEAGGALGVVGRNGSGKSTLLQVLAGALRPTTGAIEIEGRIGTLLDLTAGINPEYTGVENALVLGMLAGLSRADVQDRLEAIRAFSGLGEAFDRKVKGYSSGMTMRLGFSAAVHSDPQVLLIDEALAVGDAFYQQRCLRRMRALRDEGVTIVLVSHDPSAVISLCDQAIWLEQGEIREAGPPREVLRRYLAARYQDPSDLSSALEPIASLEEGASREIGRAAAIARMDERFGDGRAQVCGVELRDPDGTPRATVRPGEPVEAVMTVECASALANPLIGFTLRKPTRRRRDGDQHGARRCRRGAARAW